MKTKILLAIMAGSLALAGCERDSNYEKSNSTKVFIRGLGKCYLYDLDNDGLIDAISSYSKAPAFGIEYSPKVLRYFAKGYENDRRLGEIRSNPKEMTPKMRETASRIHQNINELEKEIEENQK